jgi:hypothetical protein
LERLRDSFDEILWHMECLHIDERPEKIAPPCSGDVVVLLWRLVHLVAETDILHDRENG